MSAKAVYPYNGTLCMIRKNEADIHAPTQVNLETPHRKGIIHRTSGLADFASMQCPPEVRNEVFEALDKTIAKIQALITFKTVPTLK